TYRHSFTFSAKGALSATLPGKVPIHVARVWPKRTSAISAQAVPVHAAMRRRLALVEARASCGLQAAEGATASYQLSSFPRCRTIRFLLGWTCWLTIFAD